MITIKRIAIILFLSLASITSSINAFRVDVDILNSKISPIKVAIVTFYSDKKSDIIYQEAEPQIASYFSGSDIIKLTVITDNIITKDKIIDENNLDINIYDDYDYVVFGKIFLAKKEYNTEITVFDVSTRKRILAKRYVFNVKNFKRAKSWVIKELANDIYSSTSGLKGYFNTSLLYVANDNNLMISDFNGDNSKLLIKSKYNIYSPVFSPNDSLIAYVEVEEGISNIYLYDLKDKKPAPRLIGSFKGLSLSPRFSDDGQYMIFALAYSGSTNIVEINLSNGSARKLTKTPFINLPGGYINDKNIVFYSDNFGKSDIYTLNLDDLSTSRLSQGEGSYFTPSYSSTYSIVAFTKILNKNFYIGVLDLEGREKIVSQDQFAESPSWAADGRHLIYQYMYKLEGKNNYYTFALLDVLSGKKMIISPQDNIQDPVLSKKSLFSQDFGVEYNLLSD